MQDDSVDAAGGPCGRDEDTGKLVHVGRPGNPAVTGYEEGAIALLGITFCVLALWNFRRSEESVAGGA